MPAREALDSFVEPWSISGRPRFSGNSRIRSEAIGPAKNSASSRAIHELRRSVFSEQAQDNVRFLHSLSTWAAARGRVTASVASILADV